MESSKILMKNVRKGAMDDNIYILGDGDEHFPVKLEPGLKKRRSSNIFAQISQEAIEGDDITKMLLPKRIKLETVEDIEGNDEDVDEGSEYILHNGDTIAANCLLAEDTTLPMLAQESDDGNFLVEHMDIRSPLSTLKQKLEKRFKMNLSGYKFWLQDAQMLESHRTLVDQCVQGEGLVQINFQIKADGESGGNKINIVDVLKPTDEFLTGTESPVVAYTQCESTSGDVKSKSEDLVKWVIDSNFNKELERLKVPQDPREWTQQHVKLWLLWAVRQFNLSGLKLSDWMMTGEELSALTMSAFQKIVPKDPDDLFWTHLELLRKCKFVAVVQKDKSEEKIVKPITAISTQLPSTSATAKKQRLKEGKKVSRVLGASSITVGEAKAGVGNRSGNNGQIQLWQFLLDLLTSKYHREVIQWITDDGEFKLNNPEMVAQLWGHRKNKPAMTYEKLSRALRYYYDGDMISKVHGKRFVYKFVCDLKQLLGYSASELNHRVTQSAMNSGLKSTYCDFYEHKLDNTTAFYEHVFD